MTSVANREPGTALTLRAEAAEDLMTPNPLSVREEATVREAMGFLIDHGISAAPVIDRAGRPVGVLSRSDVIVHLRENVEHLTAAPEYFDRSDLTTREGERLREGFQVERSDATLVRDLMTPVLF